MADYISRDKINEAFDSIFDCADMVFEPDDHCCAADDCGHCKWLQTKNAIKKKLDHIQPADVRPVAKARWEDETGYIFNQLAQRVYCPVCKSYAYFYPITAKNFCPHCGADMREQGAEGGA